ncbi:hypothetical protein Nepgr_003479 [Nepenthes gracilis]|uniref:Photosystem II 11 kDa protein n=1 Tax=Nepenthes gracilis TaxID=150966 RepID=A0AAD3RZL1_NEPGR|nr:hypothetical protein Nepgr_003479 [Nepenthes gracilis]
MCHRHGVMRRFYSGTLFNCCPCFDSIVGLLSAIILSHGLLSAVAPALAESNEEYVKDTKKVIDNVRTTINMDKNDTNTVTAVVGLREASWAGYRREKALLGRFSFRDIYLALNAIFGHYISFGPMAPIPAKRKAKILEEIDTAKNALQRDR